MEYIDELYEDKALHKLSDKFKETIDNAMVEYRQYFNEETIDYFKAMAPKKEDTAVKRFEDMNKLQDDIEKFVRLDMEWYDGEEYWTLVEILRHIACE